MPKISLEIKLKNHFQFLRKMKIESPTWQTRAHAVACRRGPREAGPLTRWPAGAARSQGGPRWAILQKIPRTPPNLQLSTNTIFSSLRPSVLTPRLFPNSPTHTPSDSAHGNAAGDDTARPCRPPKACAGPSVGPTFNYSPTAYTKQQRGAAGRAGASCSDARPSAVVAHPLR